MEKVVEENDLETLRGLIQEHLERTGSTTAQRILNTWNESVSRFVKIFPQDYRRVLQERKVREDLAGIATHG